MLNFAPSLQNLYEEAQRLHQMGQLGPAEQRYRQILAVDPNHADALQYLGLLGHQARGGGMGVDLMLRAVALRPENATYHNNLGVVLKDLGRLDDAIAHYRKAIELEPGKGDAPFNLGNALLENGQGEAALGCYRQALALKWRAAEVHSALLVALNYQPNTHAQGLYEETARWYRQHAAHWEKSRPRHANERSPQRRLRVGYVSADFHVHACAHYLAPLYRAHDRARVAIYSYAHVARADPMTRLFESQSDCWRNTTGLSDDALAEQIRRDEIDILVDLKLHTMHHRLLVFARKPAPVQVSWLGYPGTTGVPAIDYRLSDPYLDPPGGEAFCSESTYRLPDTFWCYHPLTEEPGVNPLPALSRGQVTFGSFNTVWKLNAPTLQLWARILQAVPGARLMLQAPESSLRGEIRNLFAGSGIEADRLLFRQKSLRGEYLAAYHGVDIGLDPFPYNGHTTSLDSLWMGVPVVSLIGNTGVGRAGLSQLMTLGLPEFAASTAEGYVQTAVKWAGDLAGLAALRGSLRGRMQASPLMDAPRFARAMEEAYRQMWGALVRVKGLNPHCRAIRARQSQRAPRARA